MSQGNDGQAHGEPGLVRVRLDGDTVAADVLTAILAGHPSVKILAGPARPDDPRHSLTVRVLSPAEILAALSTAPGESGQ